MRSWPNASWVSSPTRFGWPSPGIRDAMREAYQVAAVRAAERALMELVPDGALMGRAAAGLAAVCASLLGQQPGRVYGARVVVLAGSGDNGGDALYAGASLARRGAAVTAACGSPSPAWPSRPSKPARPAPQWWPSTCPAASTPAPERSTGLPSG